MDNLYGTDYVTESGHWDSESVFHPHNNHDVR